LLTSVIKPRAIAAGSLAGSRMNVLVHATHSAGSSVKCGQVRIFGNPIPVLPVGSGLTQQTPNSEKLCGYTARLETGTEDRFERYFND
jgi:hypothetical protein